MKKVAFLCSIFLLFHCTENGSVNQCFPFISVNETVNLDLPQFIDLQILEAGHIQQGYQGLIVYNLNGVQFKAYDRLCLAKISPRVLRCRLIRTLGFYVSATIMNLIF